MKTVSVLLTLLLLVVANQLALRLKRLGALPDSANRAASSEVLEPYARVATFHR
jgi:hypothetical protein